MKEEEKGFFFLWGTKGTTTRRRVKVITLASLLSSIQTDVDKLHKTKGGNSLFFFYLNKKEGQKTKGQGGRETNTFSYINFLATG